METYRTQANRPLEIEPLNSHALISWRSIVAGLLIALFTMAGFIGLSLAMGGMSLDADTTAKSIGVFSGIWFLVATIISLFVGSYFAARVSKFRTSRVGSAQGLVIAALFLGIFVYQTIAVIASMGSAASSVIGKTSTAVAIGADRTAGNSVVANTISNITENALGDLNLRVAPSIVAEGVGTRLLRGDSEGAKIYLARQAGLTPAEVDARIIQIRTQIDRTIADAKEATATALRATGWTLLTLVVLGALSAIGGGAVGSVANFKKPLIRENDLPHGYHA